jgi:hypothetical protein
MVEIMSREATSCDLKDLVAKFIPEAIGKDIEKSCQGIYPLQVRALDTCGVCGALRAGCVARSCSRSTRRRSARPPRSLAPSRGLLADSVAPPHDASHTTRAHTQPRQNVAIRKVKVLKAPKFDLTKLMEVHGDYTEEVRGVGGRVCVRSVRPGRCVGEQQGHSQQHLIVSQRRSETGCRGGGGSTPPDPRALACVSPHPPPQTHQVPAKVERPAEAPAAEEAAAE